MLSLECVSLAWWPNHYDTYPDSVSRVSPPNMTIPKTLAALPNSQYDTILSDTFGKELENEVAFFLDATLAAAFAIEDTPPLVAAVLC